MSEDMPGRTPEIPERLSERMSVDMVSGVPERMSEDVPVRKKEGSICILFFCLS